MATGGKSRDLLDLLELWSKIVGSIALPAVLAGAGYLVSDQQKQNEARSAIRTQLISIGPYLTDESKRKREFGLTMLTTMTQEGIAVPVAYKEFAEKIFRDELPADTRGVPTQVAAAGVLSEAERRPALPPVDPGRSTDAPLPAPVLPTEARSETRLAAQVVIVRSPRILIQVPEPGDRDAGTRLRMALLEPTPGLPPLIVPAGIEVVGTRAPPAAELRYHKAADAELAAGVARRIGEILGTGVPARYTTLWEKDEQVRPLTFEFWFGRAR